MAGLSPVIHNIIDERIDLSCIPKMRCRNEMRNAPRSCEMMLFPNRLRRAPISVVPETIVAPEAIESDEPDNDACRWWMKGETDEESKRKKYQSFNHDITLFDPDDDDGYRTWLTTARREFEGNLSIVRGDGRTGMSIFVAHRDVVALCKALVQKIPYSAKRKSKNDVIVLLGLFAQKFHDEEGDPFGYVVDLIRDKGIQHKMEHW